MAPGLPHLWASGTTKEGSFEKEGGFHCQPCLCLCLCLCPSAVGEGGGFCCPFGGALFILSDDSGKRSLEVWVREQI